MWNLNYGTNEPTYKTGTDSNLKNRFVVAKGRGEEGRGTGSSVLVDANYSFRMDKSGHNV